MQYGLDKQRDREKEGCRRLGKVPVRGALEWKLRHLAFDDARIDAIVALGKTAASKISQELSVAQWMVGRVDELEFRKGGNDDPNGLAKAEAVGIELDSGGGFQEEGADKKVGEK